ncbi:glucosamine-6-phosphate deaminase [Robertmurraya beringensis]|uniref:Glucosamine-6-phosphate deaminase n=1 Tax=Robertmurraya beringensis TaxID=641660 RepID=A0ABV6KS82_9BACI
MKLIEVKDNEEMSVEVCKLVKMKINTLATPVLGLATGSTPERLYELLVDEVQKESLSFKNVTTFNLDEYVGISGNDRNSYRYYMNSKFFDHIDIQIENTHVPNGLAKNISKECENYESRIEELKGIDLQILGIGRNGHIGFNEPGTPFSTQTHVVELEESTRKANSRFFQSLEEVPTRAITMGIDTIMKSKEIVLLVSGEKKAEALNALINGEVSEKFPASILQKHPHVTIFADEAVLKSPVMNL